MTKPLWRTVLVPHDFSGSANHAAAIARDQVKRYDGRIVLLHVVELPSQFGPDTTLILPSSTDTPIGMREYAVRSAIEHLEDIADRLIAEGVPTTAFVRVGHAVDEINRFAIEQAVDTIVMGTHGRTGLRHLVAGSVTERIVRTANVPVLTIRHPD
jgi:nucleotide-binding universal stress UspA family protein